LQTISTSIKILKERALASKQYISIIRLFEHCDIPTGDDFNLARAKKQLQAEFGIAKDGFIEVDGHAYTRHDVMEEIDSPDFSKRLVFHRQLWKSPQILELLENSTINFATIRSEFAPFWSNKEFDVFFSPYFAGPFAYLSRTLLADMNLSDMGELFFYEDFLQPAEREEAFRPTRIFLDENERLLRNVNAENYKIIRPKIIHWIEKDWFGFFNSLPGEFYETKNDIITLLINIGVAIQKTHRRDCRKMSEQLVSLQDTPESLRSIISSNHVVYTGESSKSGNWGNMFWVGWVIFIIFRLAASDGCGESKSSSFEFKPADFRQYKMPDSILKKLEKSGIRMFEDSTKNKQVFPLK
jgi:hypothetical protein